MSGHDIPGAPAGASGDSVHPGAAHDAVAQRDRVMIAIAMRLGSAAALALMFALVKLVAAHGVNIIEAVFYRQLFALPIVLALAATTDGIGALRTQRIGAHATRMVIGLVAMSLNFGAAVLLPLPEASVIGFTVPLFATLLAALLLHEAVGPWRWGAVLAGFVGILIVLHPDGALLRSTGALVALGGAVMTAGVSIVIRQLGATEGAMTTVFWFTMLSMVPLGLLMLHFGHAHDQTAWLLLVATGLVGGIAQLLLTSALRLAPISVVLPMDYSNLIWASLLGWLLFATLPEATTLIGAPIIVGSGLIILWRERRLGQRTPE